MAEKNRGLRSKHGMCDTKLYYSYHNMKGRCFRKSSSKFDSYGARGITICDEWLGVEGFNHFKEWALANGYEDGLTIERIDVNDNYCPENCKWIPHKEQAINRRTTHWVTLNGISKPISYWCAEYHINQTVVKKRLDNGWNAEKALSTPTHIGKRIKCVETGIVFESVRDASRQTGLAVGTIINNAKHIIQKPYKYHFEYV